MSPEDSVAAVRLASLQQISHELAAALTPEQVADVMVERATSAFGGLTGSLWLLREDGETLELVREVGLAAGVESVWRRFPASADLPGGHALRSRRPVVLGSRAERDRRYPQLADPPSTSSSFVVLPLVVEQGDPLGVFTLGFPDERFIGEDDLGFLDSLAALCAQNLHRARLLDASRQAAARLGFLEQAGAVLTSSLDYGQTLDRVVALAVPTLADMCAVTVLGEDGEPDLVALQHVDAGALSTIRRLATEHPWGMNPEIGVGLVLRTGEAQWYPVVDDEVIGNTPVTELERTALDSLGFGAGCAVPLSVRGRVIGVLSLGNRVGRPLTFGDFQAAQVLARRMATSIDNARLFAERTRVAETLQQSLLPPTLPRIEGLEFGARYVPMPEAVVGGDFYDVVRVGTNSWLLAIGDVCGKGVDAARHTALVRHTIWSAAVDRASPGDILRHVNTVVVQFAASQDDSRASATFCTVALVLVDVRDGESGIVVCVAGHPVPVLVRDGGAATPVGRPGSALGRFDEVALHETAHELRPGAALVLYTDGVAERHEGRRFFDETGVAEAAVAASRSGPQAVADAIVGAATSFTDTPPADDMAVLVVRRAP